jgi:thiol-disulfide isomerase/thioredoxin
MILPDTVGEWFYIDRNYNQDLSDDGPPDFFRFDQSVFTFDIVSRTDTLQRTRLLLARTLKYVNIPDSLLDDVIDSEGNMVPSHVKSWGMMTGNSSFTGTLGSFYWDDRLCLRVGRLQTEQQFVRLAVYDSDNNGLFSDSADQIIIATGDDEEMSAFDPARVYQLSDVIPLLGSNWEVVTVDRYGRSLTLEQTNRPLHGVRRTSDDTTTASAIIDEAIWGLPLTDIDGQKVSLDQYKGSTILLNFWGEWCSPCLAEIPELVETASLSATHRSFRVVSILKAGDIKKARKVIHDRGISWPQYLETPEIAELFKLNQYPTNYLLYPDGRTADLLHSVDSSTIGGLLK